MASRAAERADPDSDVGLLAEHKSRYRFAANTTAPQRLLDIACGSGLGFSYFPAVPLVVGADLEVDALRLADNPRLGAPNTVTLARTDGTALPFRSGAFDVITSFETVEHIPDDGVFSRNLPGFVAAGGSPSVNPERHYYRPIIWCPPTRSILESTSRHNFGIFCSAASRT